MDLCERLADALAAHQARVPGCSRRTAASCAATTAARSPSASSGALVDAAERLATLPHRGVHCLRHTFGAHLAMRGASPKAIQELMRHADLAMTQRYTHLSPAARESAVRLLDHPAPAQENTRAARTLGRPRSSTLAC